MGKPPCYRLLGRLFLDSRYCGRGCLTRCAEGTSRVRSSRRGDPSPGLSPTRGEELHARDGCRSIGRARWGRRSPVGSFPPHVGEGPRERFPQARRQSTFSDTLYSSARHDGADDREAPPSPSLRTGREAASPVHGGTIGGPPARQPNRFALRSKCRCQPRLSDRHRSWPRQSITVS